ncbi:MAG: hypothetical protein E7Z93_05140 [Cyanobacteria bacterium SIG32]|nr:hypothetical protein [Cyanobacteria bacterium SIG32]
MQVVNSHFSNNIYPVQFEGAVKFKRASLFDSRKLCSFEVDHPKYNQLNVTTTKQKRGKYSIEVGSTNNLKLAKEDFYIYPKENELYGANIRTHANYRHHSLGEISRVASIITMLQNNLDRIKIYSIGDAVMFHHKYKFEPNITDRSDAIRVLKYIMDSKFDEYKDPAQLIFIKSTSVDGDYSEFLAKTNEFTKQFLDDIITNKKYDNRTFEHWNLDMVLTREKVLENKDFFNNLLKKHNIEYAI